MTKNPMTAMDKESSIRDNPASSGNAARGSAAGRGAGDGELGEIGTGVS
jgi:hypothetical protein